MKSSKSICDTEDQSGHTEIHVKVQRSTADLFYEACKANGENPAEVLTDAISIYIAERLAVKAGLETALGIDSCGMLLSAVHTEEGEEKLHLLMVDNHIPAGAKLY